MRLLIIGCGSIGMVLANAADSIAEIDRYYLTDKIDSKTKAMVKDHPKARFVGFEDDAILKAIDGVELVIEAASQEAVRKYAPICLERGRDIMIMSVGAFEADDFRERCFELSKSKHGRLYIPSGAVCGTDGLRSASASQIDEVHLITTKGPDSFKNVPYLIEKKIDLTKLKEPTALYDGPAREVLRLFPKNINVAATVSMLGVGFEKTRITLVCDPKSRINSHLLIVKGPFGEIRAETKNTPFPTNPSTSYLAALSAVAALKSIVANRWIGV
jgi:aspartate dehydrogenase